MTSRPSPKCGVYFGYAPGRVFSWPYYGVGRAWRPSTWGVPRRPSPITLFPLGEVEIQRGETVQATDGGIGRVQDPASGPSNYYATHVLLEEGNLCGLGLPVRRAAADGDYSGTQAGLPEAGPLLHSAGWAYGHE